MSRPLMISGQKGASGGNVHARAASSGMERRRAAPRRIWVEATPRGDSPARKDSFLALLVSGGGLLNIHYSYAGIDRRYTLE